MATIHMKTAFKPWDVTTMPVEVWLNIFSLYLADVEDAGLNIWDFPINFFYASWQFRRLVLAHLSMWKDLACQLHPGKTLNDCGLLLKELKPYGVCPTQFTLDFGYQGKVMDTMVMPAVRSIGKPQWRDFMPSLGSQITSITLLHVCTESLVNIPSGCFPHLKSLILSSLFDNSQRSVGAFETCPMLTKVAMLPFSRSIRLPLKGLTHIAFWNARLSSLRQMDLSQVEVLHLHICHPESFVQLPPVPVLRYLSIQQSSGFNAMDQIIPLIVPTLTHLGWGGRHFSNFLSGNSLEEFCLALDQCPHLSDVAMLDSWLNTPGSEHRMKEVLKHLPGVKRLHLDWEYWNTNRLEPLMSMDYLPQLEHLLIPATPPMVQDPDVWIRAETMTAQEGVDTLKRLIEARGVGNGGRLKMFTFLEQQPHWMKVVDGWDAGITLNSSRGHQHHIETCLAQRLARDAADVKWLEMPKLIQRITDNGYLCF